MIIAIDLDGLAWAENWDEIGPFRRNFERVMRRLWDEGHIIIINSLRDVQNHNDGSPHYNAVDALEVADVKYHLFNENLPGLIRKYGEARKLSADVYIDDRDLGWVWFGGVPNDWEQIYFLLRRHPKYTNNREENLKLHHLLT